MSPAASSAKKKAKKPPRVPPITKLVKIDRSSPVPMYYQVGDQLEKAITSGVIPKGSRIENEVQLAKTLKISRPTVRRALQHLVDLGLIARKRGAGTVVVGEVVRRPLGLTSLYDDLRRADAEPVTLLLENQVVEPDQTVKEAYKDPHLASVLKITRLRLTGDEPLAIMTNYLPVAFGEFLTDRDLEREGLYDLLRSEGVEPKIATQSIGARRATSPEARLLDEQRGAAMLTMSRTTYDAEGNVIEYATHIYRASRYAVELTVTAE